MSKSNKKFSFLPILVLAALFGLCFGGGLLFGELSERLFTAGMPIEEKLLCGCGIILALYFTMTVQLIIHEFGHLVFGLASGYKFSSFRIFSFMWVKIDGKIRLRRLSLAGTGGQCLMSPPDLIDGRIPVVLYNLGGSIMNIITATIFSLLCFLLWELPFLSTVLMLLAAFGFIFALINGVPMRTGTIDNDGYNALQLTKNESAMRALWVQLKVNEEITRGVRLKDMPSEWFEVPTSEEMSNSLVATVGVFATNRLMDEMKFEEADELMAYLFKNASGMTGLHRELMVMDRMFCEMISENDHDKVDRLLTPPTKRLMKQMKNFPSVIRTEHAYALLHEKDFKKAALCKVKFENIAKSYPYPNDIQSERELIELAERKSGMDL